jgi:hypothetical protein
MQLCWLVLSAAVDIASSSSQACDGKAKSSRLPTFPSYNGIVDETKHSLTTLLLLVLAARNRCASTWLILERGLDWIQHVFHRALDVLLVGHYLVSVEDQDRQIHVCLVVLWWTDWGQSSRPTTSTSLRRSLGHWRSGRRIAFCEPTISWVTF